AQRTNKKRVRRPRPREDVPAHSIEPVRHFITCVKQASTEIEEFRACLRAEAGHRCKGIESVFNKRRACADRLDPAKADGRILCPQGVIGEKIERSLFGWSKAKRIENFHVAVERDRLETRRIPVDSRVGGNIRRVVLLIEIVDQSGSSS